MRMRQPQPDTSLSTKILSTASAQSGRMGTIGKHTLINCSLKSGLLLEPPRRTFMATMVGTASTSNFPFQRSEFSPIPMECSPSLSINSVKSFKSEIKSQHRPGSHPLLTSAFIACCDSAAELSAIDWAHSNEGAVHQPFTAPYIQEREYSPLDMCHTYVRQQL